TVGTCLAAYLRGELPLEAALEAASTSAEQRAEEPAPPPEGAVCLDLGAAPHPPRGWGRHLYLRAFPERGDPVARLSALLGELWAHGVTVDWKRYYRQRPARRVRLPTYPFEGERYWEPPATAADPPRAARIEAP